MAKVCIICQKEVAKGSQVADDLVILGIRRVKQATKTIRNNELVVCEADMGAYRKKRQGYERNLALYMAIAGIVVVLLVIVPVFTTGFSLYSVLVGLLLASLLVVLPVMTSHTPALAQVQKAEPGLAAKGMEKEGKKPAGMKAGKKPKGK